MITLIAESKQYQNNKQYIARLTGRDSKMTYRREFVGRKEGRGDATRANIDEPGIFEVCDLDKKGRKGIYFRIVVPKADGELISLKAYADHAEAANSDETVMALTKRMDKGESLTDMIELVDVNGETKYRVRTPHQAEKANTTATIDTAITTCWEVLSIMAEREQKAVLKALKDRVSPPKPKATAAPAEESPAQEAAAERTEDTETPGECRAIIV